MRLSDQAMPPVGGDQSVNQLASSVTSSTSILQTTASMKGPYDRFIAASLDGTKMPSVVGRDKRPLPPIKDRSIFVKIEENDIITPSNEKGFRQADKTDNLLSDRHDSVKYLQK